DLERNDLGRVCGYGTVRVTERKALETFPTVHHLVGTVEGTLHDRYDLIDLIKATFPGGSITGAPKIRAMEIIDELEPTKRSVYTGAIGCLGFNGNADLNIAIRTFLVNGQNLYFQVGGGIVADSELEAEYDETIHKARGLFASLGIRR
ncbi:MAG: aminodeoxychorismate synthase, component I, partial [Planctomycetes bacterium]|nr:aminodeoxychorismate synthase, component I [Planctomycetota bacterium]